MLLSRNYDEQDDYEYETWSELPWLRIYDIDITVIIDGALDYMCLESLWCFDIWGSMGLREVDIIEALNNGGHLQLIDARTSARQILTRQKLIEGLSLFLSDKNNFDEYVYSKKPYNIRLLSAALSEKGCDEIVQLALYKQIKYK